MRPRTAPARRPPVAGLRLDAGFGDAGLAQRHSGVASRPAARHHQRRMRPASKRGRFRRGSSSAQWSPRAHPASRTECAGTAGRRRSRAPADQCRLACGYVHRGRIGIGRARNWHSDLVARGARVAHPAGAAPYQHDGNRPELSLIEQLIWHSVGCTTAGSPASAARCRHPSCGHRVVGRLFLAGVAQPAGATRQRRTSAEYDGGGASSRSWQLAPVR